MSGPSVMNCKIGPRCHLLSQQYLIPQSDWTTIPAKIAAPGAAPRFPRGHSIVIVARLLSSTGAHRSMTDGTRATRTTRRKLAEHKQHSKYWGTRERRNTDANWCPMKGDRHRTMKGGLNRAVAEKGCCRERSGHSSVRLSTMANVASWPHPDAKPCNGPESPVSTRRLRSGDAQANRRASFRSLGTAQKVNGQAIQKPTPMPRERDARGLRRDMTQPASRDLK